MKRKKTDKTRAGVFAAVRAAALSHPVLTVGTLVCVAMSVGSSLIPPLLLARVIDDLAGGIPLSFAAVLLSFGSLALEGVLSSAQETLLVLFGQRMTHALRSEMSRKLTPVCPPPRSLRRSRGRSPHAFRGMWTPWRRSSLRGLSA